MDWSREQIDAGRLDAAVNRAELEEVRAILDEGVDPNIKDITGDPVIIGASWVGAPGVVRLLAERGADVNATGRDGKNALQRLLNDGGLWHDGHDQVVALLRELGSQE
jgi:ankyrin repeat protein